MRYRRILPLFPLLMLDLSVTAQIRLTQIEDFEPGHKMIYRTVDRQLDPGPGGADASWDFSTLSLKPDSIVVDILSIPEPYKTRFPRANSIEQKSDGTVIIVDKQKDKSELWGVVHKEATYAYKVPYIFIKRPFAYEDSVVSDPERNYEAYGNASGKGHTVTIADGWGKLKLPSGTYEVLRVRFEQEYTDIANGSAMKMNFVSYAWFDAEHKGALLKISRTQISSPYYNNTFEQTEYLVAEK